MEKPHLKKILQSIFLKKITVFKWQLNMFALVCTLSGLLIGTFFGVQNIIKLLAANDTVQTWVLNSSTISGYTYDNTLIQSSGGNVSGGINKVLNGTFNSDTTSWTGIQSYILDDEFSDTQPTTLVSGVSTLTNAGVITPAVGNDLFITGAGTFASGIYSWSAYGSNTVQNDSNSLKITHVDSGNGAYEYLDNTTVLTSNPVDNTWYQAQFDAKVNSGGLVGFQISNSIYGANSIVTGAEFTSFTNINRKLASQRLYVATYMMGSGETAWWDNITLKALTASSLFSTVNTSSSNVVISTGVTLTSGTQAGVVANLDSASNPQNFIIAYHDGTNVHLDKAVNGVYTTLINTASSYVAGAVIKINRDVSGYSLIYNGAQVGTAQTITDAGIINNTIHGLFSTYASNSFSNFLVTFSLNGTLSTPFIAGNGEVIRSVTDNVGRLNLGGGNLNFSTPNSSASVTYPAISRIAGRVIASQVISSSDSGGFQLPLAGSVVYGTDSNTLYVDGSTVKVGTYSASTSYNVVTVAKSIGVYYFIKGGIFTNWTLLYQSPTGNSALTPQISTAGNKLAATHDFIRVPTQMYLPTPLAYDTFTTDSATLTESVGPDSQTTPQLSWNGGIKAGGKMTITPTLGNEMISDPGFNTPSDWTIGAQWSISSGVATRVSGASINTRLTNTAGQSPVAGTWYQSTHAQAISTAGTAWLYVGNSSAGIGSAGNGTLSFSFRAINTDKPFLYGSTATFAGTFDNLSVKPLTFSSLFATVPTSQSDVIASVNLVSAPGGPSAGLAMNINSSSNPTAGLIAYYDGTYMKLSKFTTATTWTDLISVYPSGYSAGATLQVVTYHSDANTLKVRLYYNNALVGTEQTITDASIINNTNHGLFSTYSGNTFDNFTIFARGTNGEYNGIPAEDITATYDTGTKYSGSGSSKLVASGNDANYTQTINLGDTSTYQLVTYAYTNGSEVTPNDLNLFYNGNVVTTAFTPTATTGWYKLTGTITGVASDALVGVRVKAGKTLYIDEFMTYKTGLPYIYTTTAYSNPQMVTLDSFNADITNPGSSSVTFQLCPDDGSTCESGASWQYYNGTGWAVATNMSTNTNTKAQLTESVMKAFPTTSKKVSVKAILNLDADNIPTVTNIAVGMTTDVTPPTTGTNPVFDIRAGTQCTYTDNCWTDQSSPKFSWNAGTDDNTGIRGYCLYLGIDESAHPESAKGKLGTSPEPLGNTTCQFIVPNANIDLSTSGYLVTALSNTEEFLTEPNTYYLKIKAVDRADNVATNGITIRFRYDKVSPTNVSYISTPSGNFSDVADMAFSWPITGGGVANDAQSSIFGYQYQINATNADGWKGTTHNEILNLDYFPADQTTYKLTQARDGANIISGNNVIYFRAIDVVGNPSLYVSGGVSFGGQAPRFGTEDQVTVTPGTSDTNNYALSWPSATASTGSHVAHYYYMVNTPPPSTRETLEGNPSTYMDNGTSTTVNTKSLPNVNKVSNTIYVVSVDDAETPNYSPSNYITGTFTLNSSNPDNVGDLVASDSSIKSQERWNVTLTYTAPEYQGAGNLIYQIMRSSNGINYSLVGTSSGLSYVDSAPSSSKYYYKVYTKDGANALSTGSNAVEITPTGRWTIPAEIITEPEAKNTTTKKATIIWTTERASDSKIAFGIKSMEYFTEEPSNSAQVTGHTITLSGLNASTTYYYVAKWTDEDGNTGISQEQSFQTAPAPTVKNVAVSGVGLSNAMIQFTSIGSSKIKIYYGPSTSFGGTQEVYTSAEETKYTIQLGDLIDGTKYYYKINTFDSDLNEYEGTVLDFTTMPRPKITNVTLQEATGTAQTTILVSWDSNTDISSIVSYYPEGKEGQSLDQVDVKMLAGKHQMTVKGLIPQTNYILTVKGVDRIGNMAQSESQRFTTATDTRPPVISNLSIQGQIIPGSGSSEDSTAQLVVSWNTDEPATFQVEFGVGSGSTYSQKTQLDSNLTYNHIVVISGLVPSTVYHLRALSLDVIGNSGSSVDTVTIAPKATANALNLVISNLADIFRFLKK